MINIGFYLCCDVIVDYDGVDYWGYTVQACDALIME